MLEPCEDLDFLLRKFQRDVCAVMGVPDDIMGIQQKGGTETVRKTMATGRVFSSNMQDLCRQLSLLLGEVYQTIYKKDNAEFTLIPMPRLEIECVADLKVLSEIGALNPDMSLQISQIVLGEDIDNKRKRMRLMADAQGQQQRQQDQARLKGDGGTFIMNPGEVQELKGKGKDKPPVSKKGDAKKADTAPRNPKGAGSG
jgi:hypothetical protein